MKFLNRVTGRLGEDIALKYLLDKGFELVVRNFGTKFGEVDLIMKDGAMWVFVEVKTKKGLQFGTPEEMFTRGKYNKVKHMATVYLKGEDRPCRVDMVAVELDEQNEPINIRHYENVILR